MRPYAMVAARNNAEWCDIVCRSHGVDTRWGRNVWVARRRSPPLYPDAVTVSADARADGVLRLADSAAGCSVKDSFASLDLSTAGFRVLFEAEWIRCPSPPPNAPADGLDWHVVRTADGLRAWGAAHGGGQVFRPDLLDHPTVTVLAAFDGATIVGAAIANRSDDVVGLSNVFTAGVEVGPIWTGAVAAASARFPGLTLVGYESGADLDAAREHGFVTTGPLRVWLRDTA